MKVLITGIAGVAGRAVATRLVALGHWVVGIDRRTWPNSPDGVTLHRFDIRKRGAEEVFRQERPDAVVHLATVTHLNRRSEDRYRINLEGTRAIFDHAHTYRAKQVIFIGRHTFYGAGPDSPLYHHEDDPPRSTNIFPELSDLVAADMYAGSALWRYPELQTSILRMCYTLGPSCSGTLASYLRGPRVPTVLGYDPLFHFMHEDDMAHAITCAIDAKLRGVFNVAGPAPVPLSILIRETGRTIVPLPSSLFRLALGRLGMPHLSKGAVAHLKYPVVINADAFRRQTGFIHQNDLATTISQFVKACPCVCSGLQNIGP